MGSDDRARGDVQAVRALARLARLMERASGGESGGLSLAHYRVLAAISDGDVRASHVARRLDLGKPTVSSSVDALCRRGLLVREVVAGDQRAAALVLTDDGRAVLADAERSMTARLGAVLAHTERPDEAVAALARLGHGLDAASAQRLGGAS